MSRSRVGTWMTGSSSTSVAPSRPQPEADGQQRPAPGDGAQTERPQWAGEGPHRAHDDQPHPPNHSAGRVPQVAAVAAYMTPVTTSAPQVESRDSCSGYAGAGESTDEDKESTSQVPGPAVGNAAKGASPPRPRVAWLVRWPVQPPAASKSVVKRIPVAAVGPVNGS